MRVIARGTLTAFVHNRVSLRDQKGVQVHLDAWYAEISRAAWRSSAELKRQYRSASILSAERVVFNIRGNHYRLVVAISYAFQIVMIKWIGTHEEYDRIDAMEVMYDESRYADSSSAHGR